MNAVMLGIVVFKALKRSAPIVFADHLVYVLAQHHFWFRFINTDADQLREVKVEIQLVQPKGPNDTNSLYDTQTSLVKFDYHPAIVPPLRLLAIKTKSNGGQPSTAPSGDFQPLIMSPENVSGVSGEYVELTVRGYFEATGDLLFASKRYALGDIRCGRYEGVDNNFLLSMSDRQKAGYLSPVLNRIISTTTEQCVLCPYHDKCRLDIALKTRLNR